MQEVVKRFIDRFPNHQQHFDQFKVLHDRKLWNELSNKILSFLYSDDVRNQCPFDFYLKFVKKFEISIDQIKLMRIIKATIATVQTEQAIQFLQELENKGFLSEQSKIICSSLLGIKFVTNDISKCLTLLESIRKKIQDKKDIDQFVYSTFYEFAYRFYRQKNNFKLFYSNALQFLAYTTPQQIDNAEKVNLSFQMGISTLVSEQIYNFSELLEQPLLQSLKNSAEYEWTYRLLEIFNKGDIRQYANIKNAYQIQANDVIKNNQSILDQKIRIMAFLQLLFNLPKNDRVLGFEKIANSSGISVDDVELMVMRTMALGLVKGSIDQLKKIVTITWIAPKVLQNNRIAIMQSKFEEWSNGLKKLTTLLKDNAEKK